MDAWYTSHGGQGLTVTGHGQMGLEHQGRGQPEGLQGPKALQLPSCDTHTQKNVLDQRKRRFT